MKSKIKMEPRSFIVHTGRTIREARRATLLLEGTKRSLQLKMITQRMVAGILLYWKKHEEDDNNNDSNAMHKQKHQHHMHDWNGHLERRECIELRKI
mmetsp:Transcript_69277/g.77507  ORF Transcript_69277/g.77507 Transcript_69277/m.77507 type:complete len:97 (+) Transcript_69277:200-490(+)